MTLGLLQIHALATLCGGGKQPVFTKNEHPEGVNIPAADALMEIFGLKREDSTAGAKEETKG